MAENTPNLDLYLKNLLVDGNDTFNIETMLNENFRKIDKNVAVLDPVSGKVPVDQIEVDFSSIETHLEKDVSESEVHGMRVTNGKFEFLDGTDWKQVGGGEASEVEIDDPGNYYSSTDVNGALQEIGQAFNGLRGNIIAGVNAIAQK